MVAGILKSRTFTLYGRSGLGKTSLVLAGVVPRLESHRCRPVVVRALVDPAGDLRSALLDQFGGEASDTLRSIIDRVDDDGPVVIVFDQFEEFFVRFADHAAAGMGDARGEQHGFEERRQRRVHRQLFVRQLGELAAAADLNLRLVFSLREDWVAQMQSFQAAIPDIGEGTYRLLPLTAFGVRASITRTLRAAGVDFDSQLISALVETLADVGFDPAVLQVVCSEVWSQAFMRSSQVPGARLRMTTADLERVGGVQGIFEEYLAQVTRRIPASDLRMRLQTRAVLESTITAQRTKRAAPAEFFQQRYFAIEPEELERVMALLVEHRLVRRDPRADCDWFELMHERLIGTILRWLDDDLDFFNFRAARNLLRNSCANKGWQDNPGLLLSPEQLDGTIGPFKKLLRFDQEERLFLVSSATYGRSKDLEFWAELAGYGTSAELLARFLTDDNVTIRLGAAEAAGRLKAGELDPRSARFAGRCLGLAIGDPEEIVRRAAGRSFARLAQSEHFRDLASRIKNRKTRDRALEVLDDAYEEAKIPRNGTFGRLRVRRAYERVFKRRLDRSREAIRDRARIGAKTGLLAGLLWAVTGIPLVSLSFSPSAIGCTASILFFPLVMLVSLLLGWRAAARAAEEAMSSGEEGRVFRALTGWLLRTVLGTSLFLALAALAYSLATGRGPHSHNLALSAAYPFAVALACCFTWAGLAALARPACWPGLSGRRAWLGAWLAGIATSLTGLALAMVAGEHLPLPVATDTWSRLVVEMLRAVLGLSALIGGGVVFVGLLAVARSSPGWSGLDTPALGSLPPIPARRPQAVVAVTIAGTSLAALVLLAAARWQALSWIDGGVFTDSLWLESQVFAERAPKVQHARAIALGGEDGTESDREGERALVLAELLIPWDLKMARIERELLDLTLRADEERALRAELENLAAGREEAASQARRDIASGKIEAGKVLAGSPLLRGLLAARRVQTLADAQKKGKGR